MTRSEHIVPEQMQAAVLESTGRVRLRTRPVPQIGPEDVLVQVAYVGLCGSDLALFAHGGIGASKVSEPMVLGHEASGVVTAVGASVEDLAVGDRVALEPGVPCGQCEACRSGRYNLCPQVYFWASLPVTEGALQEYVRHPARMCFGLPDSVSLLQGALVEPLSVGLHSVRQSGLSVGDSAAVLGAGGVGQLLLMCLLAAGARNLVVSDLHPFRLDAAQAIGGDRVRVTGVDGDLATAGRAPDFVFESAGAPAAMNRAIEAVRPGGTVVLLGYSHDGRADLNVNLLIDKEVGIRTTFRYRHTYPAAIEGVATGLFPVQRVVSDVFAFDQVQQAMETAVGSAGSTTRCVVAVAAGIDG